MGIGLQLKRILRDKKITIKQLSEITGISLNTLYSITKRDSKNVDEVILQKIADALEISPSDLYWEGDGPTPKNVFILTAGPQGVRIVDEDRHNKISVMKFIQEQLAFISKYLDLSDLDDLYTILDHLSECTRILRCRRSAKLKEQAQNGKPDHQKEKHE